MLSLARRLKQAGVLGINHRNSAYALKYNPRKQYPLVDDKLKTKTLLNACGVPVPKLYARITADHQLKQLSQRLHNLEDFVVKPAHGAGGDGILVITNRIYERFRLANGTLLTLDDLAYHISCLLAGSCSLGGHPDEVLIEKRVVTDDAFASISHEGVPDIRIITLLGYPAMAMLRLPTRASSGKANLHQGAMGVGINLCNGRTQGGVIHQEAIDYHPDTLNATRDFKVPFWADILKMAASAYELTGLGYLGVDIVLDKEEGPLMLELNARPGLNIQIANRCGLLKRFQQIEAYAEGGADRKNAPSVLERVAFSRTLDRPEDKPAELVTPPHECAELP